MRGNVTREMTSGSGFATARLLRGGWSRTGKLDGRTLWSHPSSGYAIVVQDEDAPVTGGGLWWIVRGPTRDDVAAESKRVRTARAAHRGQR